MPWIREELCVGCEICVRGCPVDAISLDENRKAVIDDDICIRCGRCHKVCPRDAVRHDSERISLEVGGNIIKIQLLSREHYPDDENKKMFFERMMKHYKMRQKVLALSMEKLQNLIDNCRGD